MTSSLTSEEALYFFPLLFILLIILGGNVFSSTYYKLWSPLSIVAITYFYYVIAGPLLSIYFDDTYVRLVDHRMYFLESWKAALISLIFIIIGYHITADRYIRRLESSLNISSSKYANRLFILGIIGGLFAFGFSSITSVNFLSGDSLEQNAITGGFRNYFLFMMNLFIPASAIMLLLYLKRKYSLAFLLIAVGYAVALYVTLGFRYRVVLIILSLLATYYLYKKKKPNYLTLSILAALTITFMGIIGSTRTYFSGLQKIETISDKSFFDLFLSGFSEAQTFQSTGLLIANVPRAHDYVGFLPIYESLAMPIPRLFWPSKPSGESLESISDVYEYETGIREAGTGAALLNYGEHYLAFGWIGVIIGGFLLGIILRLAWNWYLVRKDNDLAIVFIAVFNCFIYVIISRGYLPQVTMNFFFTVFPIILLYRSAIKINQE